MSGSSIHSFNRHHFTSTEASIVTTEAVTLDGETPKAVQYMIAVISVEISIATDLHEVRKLVTFQETFAL